jgi:hypothetical protein
MTQRAVVVGALGVLVATSSVEVVDAAGARGLLGLTDLALALSAIAAVLVGECRKQRLSPRHPDGHKKPVGRILNSGTPG